MQISIIIPVYNVEKYLRQCVDSVLAQTYTDWELILVDDGSPDNCPELCDDYASKDSRIRVIHQPNEGVSVARNSGIKISRGRYICFIDSDDEVHSSYLQTLINLIEDYNADVSCVDLVYCKEDYKESTNKIGISVYKGNDFCRKLLYQNDRLSIPSPCAKLYKRELIPDDFFPKKKRYEDLLALSMFFSRDIKVVCSCAKLYFYRSHSYSFLHQFSEDRKHVLDVVDEIEKYYSKSGMHPDEILHQAARDRRLSAHFNIFGLMVANNYKDKALEDRCWSVIKTERFSSLMNPEVRLKNKLGALLSYLGKPTIRLLSKFIYNP